MTTNYEKALENAPRNGDHNRFTEPPDLEIPEGPLDPLHYGIDPAANDFTATARKIGNMVAAGREPGDDSEGVPRTKDGYVKEFVDPFDGNRVTFRTLRQQHPTMHAPIIGHLLRAGETMNLISVSKIGKSWMMYGLLLSIVTGRPWLGRFPTSKGRVLLIDNELHKPTLAFRIKTVAEAMGITENEYADHFEIWAQRGDLQDIFGIIEKLADEEFTERDRYVFMGLDAKYRAVPAGKTENDNQAETQFYNAVDRLAMRTRAGCGMVHHSTKGLQTEKRVTDVGSGAGAQSRAADCHLVIREHEEEDTVVLEAAVRSFAPVEPIVLRWVFPLWIPDDAADPTMLKGKKTVGDEKQSKADTDADELVLRIAKKPHNRQQLKVATGYGYTRLDRCIRRLVDSEQLTPSEVDQNGKPITVYQNVGDE